MNMIRRDPGLASLSVYSSAVMLLPILEKVILQEFEELYKHQAAADRHEKLGYPQRNLKGLRKLPHQDGALNHLDAIPGENPGIDEAEQSGEQFEKEDRPPGNQGGNEINPGVPFFLERVSKEKKGSHNRKQGAYLRYPHRRSAEDKAHDDFEHDDESDGHKHEAS